QRGRDGALAAAGEDDPVSAVCLRQRGLVVDRQALLPAGQVGLADHLAQPRVYLRVAGQHQQVPPAGIRDPGPRPGGGPRGPWTPPLAALAEVQAELRAEDRV